MKFCVGLTYSSQYTPIKNPFLNYSFRIETLVISKQLQKIFSVNNIIDRIISSFPNSKSTNFNKLKIYL